MNTQIGITQNGTTTLATAGKYCDRNVDVNVSVDNLHAFVDGTIEGEYISDKVTDLRMGAFSQCVNLTYISLPNCVTINQFRTFFQCSNVTDIKLPSLTTITDGTYTFGQMSKITEINLPNLTTIATMSATFHSCSELQKINLPKLSGTTIGTQAFRYCNKLHTLILGGDTLNPLANTNAFDNSNTSLKIYVPDTLVDTYKAATNWSSIADKIKPLSELEE